MSVRALLSKDQIWTKINIPGIAIKVGDVPLKQNDEEWGVGEVKFASNSASKWFTAERYRRKFKAF